ncbi:11364_t:CDS:1 [Funneliformis geosporum]|uniref:14970_t:CDS:1 n=1 Tax=Funneliformis geosporum TaxID=1117311 RepID=A0A9W4SHX9_9GLOM|nr:11364_t:CDS:1 [Funneliformis geosporum]CAI2170094.1 14970_t:CDS:1 [Funneliformis geosporum]
MSQLALVASALSSFTSIKTYDECVANKIPIAPTQILDANTNHVLILSRYVETEKNASKSAFNAPSKGLIQIFVITLSGESRAMLVFPQSTVLELKHVIQEKLGYIITQIRLELACKPLEDDKSLASYDIKQGDNVNILFRLLGGYGFYVIKEDLLDRKYDRDYTNRKNEGKTYFRGKLLYHKPYGWKRIALNVSGKYGSNNKWLGSVGDSSDEWPVSYHGTKKDCADSIANQGYLLSKGVRFAKGKGIYSSPKIEVAEQFAIQFVHAGYNYKVVFQNRVNPVGLVKYDDIHYWVTPDEKNIRPYGLCVKKV